MCEDPENTISFDSHRSYITPFVLSSVVFWFGDLNFRIEDYDIHVVKCAIDSNKLPLLWERDQVSTSNKTTLFFFYFLLDDQQRVLPLRKLSSCDVLYRPLQLNMAKNTESILEGFIEGPLHFPPTYKFDVGTHTYDTRFVAALIQTLTLTRQLRILII